MTNQGAKKFEHSCKTVPQVGEESIALLLAGGIPEPLVEELLSSISSIGQLLDRIPERIRVTFPATKPKPDQLSSEFLVAHWEEIAGRSQIAQLCADRTLRDLLRGFVSTVQSCNVVLGSLSARAAIENAAAYDSLSRFLGGRKEKIEAEVLPFIRGNATPLDLNSLYDPLLVEDLIRFRHGARLWPTGDCPETVKEWKTWCKHSSYESKKDASEKGREQSIAGQLLDVLNADQRNVLTCIQKVSKRAQNMAVLGLYLRLSEFCHPNADNRSLGIESSVLNGEQAIVEFVGTAPWTPGATKGTWLSILGMVEAIKIHISAHNAIHDSAHELFVAIKLR